MFRWPVRGPGMTSWYLDLVLVEGLGENWQAGPKFSEWFLWTQAMKKTIFRCIEHWLGVRNRMLQLACIDWIKCCNCVGMFQTLWAFHLLSLSFLCCSCSKPECHQFFLQRQQIFNFAKTTNFKSSFTSLLVHFLRIWLHYTIRRVKLKATLLGSASAV